MSDFRDFRLLKMRNLWYSKLKNTEKFLICTDCRVVFFISQVYLHLWSLILTSQLSRTALPPGRWSLLPSTSLNADYYIAYTLSFENSLILALKVPQCFQFLPMSDQNNLINLIEYIHYWSVWLFWSGSNQFYFYLDWTDWGAAF